MKTHHPVLLAAAFALLHSATASAGVVFFSNDAPGFATAVAGNTLLGVETFEGNNSAGNVVFIDDPLAQGVANGPFTAGLAAPVTIQSNVDGGSPTSPNPRGTSALALIDAGVLSAPTDQVVALSASDSFDMIFDAMDQVTGVGFDLIAQDTPDPAMQVRVYDTGNSLLGMFSIASDRVGTNFLGVQGTGGDLIGRINLFSSNNQSAGGDNIQIYSVPEPSSAVLLALGGVALLRRRAGS